LPESYTSCIKLFYFHWILRCNEDLCYLVFHFKLCVLAVWSETETLAFSGEVTTLVEPYVGMLNFYMFIVYYMRELSFYKWDDDEGHSGYYSRLVMFSDLFTALAFFQNNRTPDHQIAPQWWRNNLQHTAQPSTQIQKKREELEFPISNLCLLLVYTLLCMCASCMGFKVLQIAGTHW
jgi:hypothetical protein